MTPLSCHQNAGGRHHPGILQALRPLRAFIEIVIEYGDAPRDPLDL